MDRKWTPKENEQFISCWGKLIHGEMTRDHFMALFPHRTWEYLHKHAEIYVGVSMPEGMMTLTAAAKKAGYSRQALERMMLRYEKQIVPRSGRKLNCKNPQAIVRWVDVLEAIKLDSEYMSANKAATVLSMCRADLIKILRALKLIEVETQQRKSIMIHVSVVEEIRKKREEKHPSIPIARKRTIQRKKVESSGNSRMLSA